MSEWNEAATAMDGREAKMDAVADKMERDLQLIGATAIEDKLQDEVPETIHNLLRAGIKVWVITGDKQATAINIGYSCRLLNQNMDVVVVNAETSEDCGEQLRSHVNTFCTGKERDRKVGLVIDGATLKYALNEQADLFLQLTTVCHSVVCCRVTPLQKANVVKLIKEHSHEVCLSIGDGANDVSMIQEAHIGVGIYGKEGSQAARASDYAIRQFKHLRRLVTMHGRWSYIRNSGLIQYSIYKNTAVFLVQFWFAFYCGYSAMTIYDDWIVTFFNILFTSIPPFLFAALERDIGEDLIEEYPEAFRTVQTGDHLTYSSMFLWMLNAIWHSIVFFFGNVLLLQQEPFMWNGKTSGIRMLGNMTATMAITTVILKLALES